MKSRAHLPVEIEDELAEILLRGPGPHDAGVLALAARFPAHASRILARCAELGFAIDPSERRPNLPRPSAPDSR